MELSAKQQDFIRVYMASGESQQRTAEKMGWTTRGQCSSYLANPKIAAEIARRKGELTEFLAAQDAGGKVTRDMRIELLWDVCSDSAKIIEDKNGIKRMTNAQAAIAGAKELNAMFGSYAPLKQEVHVVHTDTRSENELRAHIIELKSEFDQLVALEDRSRSGG